MSPDFTDLETAFFDRHVDDSVAEVAGVAAGVEERYAAVVGYVRPVVVGTDEHVHTLQALVEVESLALEDGTVPVTGAGMHADDDDMRLLLGYDHVHVLLHEGDKRFEMHAAPDVLVQPGLDVGVVESKHGDLEPAFLQDGIDGEVRLAVVLPYGIAPEEGDAVAFDLLGYAVIDGVSGFDVVVAPGDCVVAHVGDHA